MEEEVWYTVMYDRYPYKSAIVLHQTKDYTEAYNYLNMFTKPELQDRGRCKPLVIFTHSGRYNRDNMKRVCTLYTSGKIEYEVCYIPRYDI